MAKKKPAKEKPPKWSDLDDPDKRFQIAIRLSRSEAALFLEAASEEGFPSIQQWLLEQGRVRARLVIQAKVDKTFVRVRDRLIPISDFPEGAVTVNRPGETPSISLEELQAIKAETKRRQEMADKLLPPS